MPPVKKQTSNDNNNKNNTQTWRCTDLSQNQNGARSSKLCHEACRVRKNEIETATAHGARSGTATGPISIQRGPQGSEKKPRFVDSGEGPSKTMRSQRGPASSNDAALLLGFFAGARNHLSDAKRRRSPGSIKSAPTHVCLNVLRGPEQRAGDSAETRLVERTGRSVHRVS